MIVFGEGSTSAVESDSLEQSLIENGGKNVKIAGVADRLFDLWMPSF